MQRVSVLSFSSHTLQQNASLEEFWNEQLVSIGRDCHHDYEGSNAMARNGRKGRCRQNMRCEFPLVSTRPGPCHGADKNLSKDLMLNRALEAIGYTDGRPLFRASHPVINAATSHDARSAVFVPKTTKTLD